MSDQQMFGLANAAPLLGWLALAFAPLARRWAVAFARAWSVALAIAYLAMLVAALREPGAAWPDFGSLPALARTFSDPHAMLIGWLHYLAFDLWVGSWEVEEAVRRGMRHAVVLPCLVLTFLAGPVGLLLFLAARQFTALARKPATHDIITEDESRRSM